MKQMFNLWLSHKPPLAAQASCTFQITLQDPVSSLYLSDVIQKYIPVRLLLLESCSLLKVFTLF